MLCLTGRGSIAAMAALLALIGPARAASPRPEGFWKCRERSDIKSEFDGEDPIGLASGKHIRTNCAIHARMDGKIYCFSSLPSLSFVDADRGLLAKATAFWAAEHRRPPTD